MGALAIQKGEGLNDSFGFERDLWPRKIGQGSAHTFAMITVYK